MNRALMTLVIGLDAWCIHQKIWVILPYGLSYYGHLGASYSNIGRIRTKENIAVDTRLIGILANATGAI